MARLAQTEGAHGPPRLYRAHLRRPQWSQPRRPHHRGGHPAGLRGHAQIRGCRRSDEARRRPPRHRQGARGTLTTAGNTPPGPVIRSGRWGVVWPLRFAPTAARTRPCSTSPIATSSSEPYLVVTVTVAVATVVAPDLTVMRIW